jgi:glycosyltransferase involved in cell wall biosynthesis
MYDLGGDAIRILYSISYFNPRFGGDVNVCYNLSREMAKKGHDVTIITTDYEFDKNFAESLVGIKVIGFKRIFNLGYFIYTPAISSWLDHNIKNFDIIHLHNYRSYQNNEICARAKRDHVPFILQAHGSVPPTTDKKMITYFYDLFWGNDILKSSSKFIAITRREVEQYKRRDISEDKICIVPNGIDSSVYHKLPEKGKFREKYLINLETKLILYLGRLDRIKGIDLILESYADIINDYHDSVLVLVGPDHGHKSHLERLAKKLDISDRVLFTGFVSELEKKMALVDSDVFVTPYYYGFPVTFLEACSCGTPIIVTNKGDDLDFIQDNVGFVVENTKENLSNAIRIVFSDKEVRNKFKQRGREIIAERFTWDKISNKLEDIYLDVSALR